MKRFLCLMTVAGALLGAGEAQAQFANHSLRFTLGYLSLEDTETVNVDWGLPIGLGATSYIEAGWELTFDFQVMVLSAPLGTQKTQFVGLAGGPGIRYLFMQETFRPWAGADISYLHAFYPSANFSRVGLGPKVGVDYFLTDSFSLGAQAQANFYWMLNSRVHTSLGIQGVAAAWF